MNIRSSAGASTPLKFALYSAHDTSLMPFLAAILGERWDGRWAGYAYLISIELYSASAASAVGTGGYYFRLIYNGQALLMPGCDDTLCDVNVMLDALAFGKESMPCSVTAAAVVSDGDNCDDDDSGLSTVHWVLLLVLTLLVGGLIGAAGVVFYERRRKASDPLLNVHASTHPLHNNI